MGFVDGKSLNALMVHSLNLPMYNFLTAGDCRQV